MLKNYSIIGLVLLTLGVTSCKEDYFDVERYQSLVTEAFPVQNVDPNHKWSVTATATANVAVEGDYDTEYIVKVYRNNPMVDGYGMLIAHGKVKSGEVYMAKITYPRVDSILYVATVDEKGYRNLKPVTVRDGVLNAVFGTATMNGTRGETRTETNSLVNIPTLQAPVSYASEIEMKSVEVNNNNMFFNWFPDEYKQDYWNNPEHNNAWEPKGEPYISTNPDYVVNYKITSEWSGVIQPLANAGLKSKGVSSNRSECYPNKFNDQLGKGIVVDTVPRTVFVGLNGKWIIPTDQYQSVGEGIKKADDSFWGVDGVVIVGDGGELVVNGTLNLNNTARLIVLPGGKVSGTGTINVNNGTKAGEEGYNGGEVSVANFNQNYGIFFNYGTITSQTLIGGAGGSTFVNHGKVHVGKVLPNGGQAANMQIKNNCWFEVDNDLLAKIIENGAGAYIKSNSLAMSVGEGGEGLGSYIALDCNSKIHVDGDVKLNNTSIIGPYIGDYAFVEFGVVSQCNYTGDYNVRVDAGKVINNLYVYLRNHDNSVVNFKCMVFNQQGAKPENRDGNGHAVWIYENEANVASVEESDCAPGFTPATPPTIEEQEEQDDVEGYRFCFEDNFPEPGDYDFNDVVLTLTPMTDTNDPKVVNLTISLDAVGGLKQSAAALRLVGISNNELQSVECTSGEWFDLQSDKRGKYDIDIIGTQLGIQNLGKADPNLITGLFSGSDVVIPLFNDAHLSINPEGTQPNGVVDLVFYNVTHGEESIDVDPRVVTLKLTFSSEQAAQKVTGAIMDVFIIESYNSGYWEVHTYPYKADQVFANIKSDSKELQLGIVGYPWGIMINDKNFRYPLEFTPIGGYDAAGITGGAYSRFANWARNQNVDADWYKDVDNTKVFIPGE